jgi:hypothetical protein
MWTVGQIALDDQLYRHPAASSTHLTSAPDADASLVEVQSRSTGGATTGQRSVSSASRDGQLAAKVARLEETLASMATTLNALAGDAYAGEADLLSEPPTAEELEEMRRAEEERELEQRIAFVERLEAQEIDEHWSQAYEHDIRASLVSGLELPGAEGLDVYGVACRSTFCRLDVTADEADRLNMVMTLLPFESEAIFLPDDDTGQSGSFYIVPLEEDDNSA